MPRPKHLEPLFDNWCHTTSFLKKSLLSSPIPKDIGKCKEREERTMKEKLRTIFLSSSVSLLCFTSKVSAAGLEVQTSDVITVVKKLYSVCDRNACSNYNCNCSCCCCKKTGFKEKIYDQKTVLMCRNPFLCTVL